MRKIKKSTPLFPLAALLLLAARAGAAEEKPAAPPENAHVVFMGDSITRAWDLNRFFRDLSVKPVNRGIDGEHTGDMMKRFHKDAVRLNPAAIVILGGANDLRKNVPVKIIEENLAAMVQLCLSHDIRALLGTLPPLGLRLGMIRTRPAEYTIDDAVRQRLNAWMRDYCARWRCAVVDFDAALSGPQGARDDRYFLDGIHPNAKGYRTMAELVKAAVLKP